jgi:hypothetical protein
VVESFFAGLGGAAVTAASWETMARLLSQAARNGRSARRWHLVQDGVELDA